jgi:hypothetical protein
MNHYGRIPPPLPTGEKKKTAMSAVFQFITIVCGGEGFTQAET